MLSEHEHAGPVFNFVQGQTLLMEVNIFREGAHVTNPVAKVHGITIVTEDGEPLTLQVQDAPAGSKKALPNCLTVTAPWDPKECKSAALLDPTKWPETRDVQVQLHLELTELPGKTTTVSPPLRFQVRS